MTVSTLRLTGSFTTNHRPKAKLPRSPCGWVSHPKYGLDWGISLSMDLGESETVVCLNSLAMVPRGGWGKAHCPSAGNEE
jgi:hypothetical protein